MSSNALYVGHVEHRRRRPVPHAFRYPVCYFYLDLAELTRTFRFPFLFSFNFPGILSFWRKDYLGDAKLDLASAVRAEIQRQTGEVHHGPIRLLTNISYFGHCFNPVSFYYCFAEDGQTLQFIVAEVTNTPWNERHQQVLRFNQGQQQVYQLSKVFHVSPFMPMEIDYTWVLDAPGAELSVLMQNRLQGEKELLFDASLRMTQRPLNLTNILTMLARFPLMSFKPLLAIYWQALVLWIKRVPFHTHPDKLEKT